MNGIYLKILLAEFENKLCGRYIDEVRVDKRLIQFVTGKQALFISLYPEMLAMYISTQVKNGFDKLTKFSRLVVSNRIVSIAQDGLMPVLRLRLEKNNVQIMISLYRDAPNIIVKTDRTEQRMYKRFIQKEPKRPILDITVKELEHVYKEQPEKFPELLVQGFEGLDKNLAKELTPRRIVHLKKTLRSGKIGLRIVSISPFRISFFASDFLKEYYSLNQLFKESVDQFIIQKESESEAIRRKAQIKNIERQVTRLQKKMLSDRAIEIFRIKGELILTNLKQIRKGSKQLVVRDPYCDKELEIILDPILTPQENAEHYFSEYKKLKRGRPKIKEQVSRLKKKLEELKDPSYKMPSLKKISSKKDKRTESFRVFTLTSGSVVYIGRDARTNNELTFAFARPDDYFFHIRNYEGAHVILRAKVPRGQRPNKRDIEKAAALAAYFSKGKKQMNVPVSYTQRKYLKKNKKGKPGGVILMREDVVFVDPKLPE